MEPTILVKGYISENKNAVPVEYIINSINANKHNILILKSSTGSGKSTILPVYMWNRDMSKKVLVIQPRVFTVLGLTKRLISQPSLISSMPKFKLGVNIGYHTGQYFRIPQTGIIFITFGSFIRFFETETDEAIRKEYSSIIVDEAHEMELFSSNIYKKLRDFITRNRGHPDCPKLVFMSATIDTAHFSKYFNDAPVIEIDGRSFKITEHYLEYDTTNYLESIAETIIKIQAENPKDPLDSRDILVFFPGVREINNFLKFFEPYKKDPRLREKIMLTPIYRKIVNADDDRLKAVYLSAKDLGVSRKVILATNIGETGITYNNLKYVIDTGLFKSVEYLYDINAMIIYNKIINNLSWEQRRGRVSRTSDGEFYAMYSKETRDKISNTISNQMFKDDITYNILYLLKEDSSIDLLNLDLIYNPATIAVWRSIEKLYVLGFINSGQSLTKLGLLAAEIKGLTIEQAKALLAGFVWKAPMLDLISIIASLNFTLSYTKKTLFSEECECDIIPFIELQHNDELPKLMGDDYENYIDLRDNLIDTLAVIGLDPYFNHEKCFPNNDQDYVKILKQCLFEGYKINSAYWDGSKHITQSGNELYINHHCHVNNFIYVDLIITKKDDKIIQTPTRTSILDNYINYTGDLF